MKNHWTVRLLGYSKRLIWWNSGQKLKNACWRHNKHPTICIVQHCYLKGLFEFSKVNSKRCICKLKKTTNVDVFRTWNWKPSPWYYVTLHITKICKLSIKYSIIISKTRITRNSSLSKFLWQASEATQLWSLQFAIYAHRHLSFRYIHGIGLSVHVRACVCVCVHVYGQFWPLWPSKKLH